jgi:RNase P subunit RPR2
MTDWIKKAHEERCENKQAFRSAELADELALKASMKLGKLVISYECCDCGQWHIGHADKTQITAHRPLDRMFCVECSEILPEQRLLTLRVGRSSTMTCSPACTKKRNQRTKRNGRMLQLGGYLQQGGRSFSGNEIDLSHDSKCTT